MKLIALSAFLSDQAFKYWANKNIAEGEKVRVGNSKLILTNLKNRGMAFGFLARQRGTLLTVSILAVVNLFQVWRRTSGREKIGAALMMGGGISNVYDRLAKGKVTDYVYIESKKPAPVFNLADIFVIAGCLFIMISRFCKKNG